MKDTPLLCLSLLLRPLRKDVLRLQVDCQSLFSHSFQCSFCAGPLRACTSLFPKKAACQASRTMSLRSKLLRSRSSISCRSRSMMFVAFYPYLSALTRRLCLTAEDSGEGTADHRIRDAGGHGPDGVQEFSARGPGVRHVLLHSRLRLQVCLCPCLSMDLYLSLVPTHFGFVRAVVLCCAIIIISSSGSRRTSCRWDRRWATCLTE